MLVSGEAVDDDDLLAEFARAEAAAEAGPYRRYREILGRAIRDVGRGRLCRERRYLRETT